MLWQFWALSPRNPGSVCCGTLGSSELPWERSSYLLVSSHAETTWTERGCMRRKVQSAQGLSHLPSAAAAPVRPAEWVGGCAA